MKYLGAKVNNLLQITGFTLSTSFPEAHFFSLLTTTPGADHLTIGVVSSEDHLTTSISEEEFSIATVTSEDYPTYVSGRDNDASNDYTLPLKTTLPLLRSHRICNRQLPCALILVQHIKTA
jgi:hypothetical protein